MKKANEGQIKCQAGIFLPGYDQLESKILAMPLVWLKAIKNKKATYLEILDLKFGSPNIKIVVMKCPKIGLAVIGRMIMKQKCNKKPYI